jgi:NAD+ kinase
MSSFWRGGGKTSEYTTDIDQPPTFNIRKMKAIGVIINSAKPRTGDVLPRLIAAAKRHEIKLFSCQTTTIHLPDIGQVDPANFVAGIDALITLGGDGTLLKAVPLMTGKNIPVLGVNLGRLGFLTSVTEAELENGVDALVTGNYTTSTRTMLEARISSRSREEHRNVRALNDMVIGWGQSTRIVTLDVSINDETVTSYRCDGIIVSTPTGSTGHSLSAGGPIIHPEAKTLILNVICPHTLSARPLIIPDDARIQITVKQTGKQLLLSVDGQDGESLSDGDTMIIRKSDQKFHLVHLPGYQYFSVLRKKLQWSGSSA